MVSTGVSSENDDHVLVIVHTEILSRTRHFSIHKHSLEIILLHIVSVQVILQTRQRVSAKIVHTSLFTQHTLSIG